MTDTILIVGGGVAGLHAAKICAEAGARAIVVERQPVVGGRLAAAMASDDSIGDRAEGETLPSLESIASNENIEILPMRRDRTVFDHIDDFTIDVDHFGYYGGIRIIKAAIANGEYQPNAEVIAQKFAEIEKLLP